MIKSSLRLFCFIFFSLIITLIPHSAFALQQNIIILYTNDVHCGIEDNLGYAKVAGYKQDLLQQNPNVILVDAGDAIQGTPIGKLTNGEAIINIMNTVGYDFAIPGNHEFDYGMTQFLSLIPKLNCGYYGFNLIDKQTNKNILPAYKIFQFEDTKVALIGATTPSTLTSSTPTYFQDEQHNFIYTFCEDSTGQKFYDKLQQTVNTVRELGADYVILVGHLGINGSTPRYSSITIANSTQGIDAIIDSHSHEIIPNLTINNKQGKPVLITQTGTKLQYLGKLTITPQGDISSELLNNLTTIDTATANAITQENIKFEPLLQQTIGKSTVKLTTIDPQTKLRLVRSGETNFGDFVTDAFKTVLHADVAIANGGSIRNELPINTFTYNDILTTFPFSNMCISVEVTGQQLLDALELGAMNAPEEFGGFLQISGATYTIDTTIPSNVLLNEQGNFVKVNGAYRVKDVQINGKPLDLQKKYTVAGTSYILHNGGNGMTMFNYSKIVQNEYMTDVDVLIEYIQNHLNATIGSEYANPYGQNRIKIIK